MSYASPDTLHDLAQKVGGAGYIHSNRWNLTASGFFVLSSPLDMMLRGDLGQRVQDGQNARRAQYLGSTDPDSRTPGAEHPVYVVANKTTRMPLLVVWGNGSATLDEAELEKIPAGRARAIRQGAEKLTKAYGSDRRHGIFEG